MKNTFIAAALIMLATTSAHAQSVETSSTAGSQSYSGIQNEGDTVHSSTAIAPSMNSTAPCVVGTSFGVGGLGAGVSFGSGRIDKQCIAKADAALLRDLARMRAAGDPGWRAAVVHLYSNHRTIRQSLVALGWVQER